jgi:hypothetical protein
MFHFLSRGGEVKKCAGEAPAKAFVGYLKFPDKTM